MTLHQLLDIHFGDDGDADLRHRLPAGEDPERRGGPLAETALHAAGAAQHCPGDDGADAYRNRLLKDASDAVRELLSRT